MSRRTSSLLAGDGAEGTAAIWSHRAALGLAGMRVALGAAAVLAPELAGRAWIGSGASGRDRAVALRALGGRDIALGAGALLAAADRDALRGWVAMGAMSDLVDALASAVGFDALPRRRRWLVLVASAGAAVAGALASVALGQAPS